MQVGIDGRWTANGWSGALDASMRDAAVDGLDDPPTSEHTVWLEADVPLPEERTIEAEVKA